MVLISITRTVYNIYLLLHDKSFFKMIMKLFFLVSHKVGAGVDQHKPQQTVADYFC